MQGGVSSPADTPFCAPERPPKTRIQDKGSTNRDAKNESPNMENNISEPAPPSAVPRPWPASGQQITASRRIAIFNRQKPLREATGKGGFLALRAPYM
jgi:hypothetical protein